MKKHNALKITLVVLTILILAPLLIVFFWLGPTVKAVAENIGSKALGTPLKIEQLAINPRHGTLVLSGFSAANPEGFNSSNILSLAAVDIAVDMGSVFSETVLVHNVQIDSPHVTYEMNAASDNLSELLNNIFTFAEIDPQRPPAPKEEKENAAPAEPKIVIVERFNINDLQAHLANTDDPQLDITLGIEQLALSLTNGVIALDQLTFSNPNRLETENLFELEGIHIKLDPATLYAPPLAIEDIQITAPHAYIEAAAETDTLAELLKIADRLTARTEALQAFAPPATAETTEPPAAKPTEPPVLLHNLLVDDIQVKLLDSTNTNAPANPQALATIGNISVKLVDGLVHIGEITLPNLPADFTTTNLFHLAGIDIALAPESIFSDQVIINRIFVDSPNVNLEKTETTGNIAELQKLAQALTPPQPQTAAAAEQAPPQPPPHPVPLAEMPVLLNQLVVTNLAVNMVFPVDTNALANAFPMPSLGTLNPMGLLGGSDEVDTNAVEEIEIDGQLTLAAFNHLLVEPLNGNILLTDLEVGNPEGFANKNIVHLDAFQFGFEPDSVQSNILVIREILIDNPTIAYERKLTTDNIKALQKFIEAATTPATDGEPAEEEKEETDPEKQKVVIGHLLVKSGMIKAKLSALPSAPIPLPKIEMRDIGKEKGGTTPVAAATEIGAEFQNKIIGAVAGATGFAGDALKGVGKLALPNFGEDDQETTAQAEQIQSPETSDPAPAPLKPKKKRRVRLPGRRY